MASRDSILTNIQPHLAFRILTIVARPLDEAELPDIADAWALTDGLTQIEAAVDIRFLQPPTIEALRTALLDPWDVVHFDGHGGATNDGGLLAFEADDGTCALLSAPDFAEMLSLSGSIPKLIILSACESALGINGGLAGTLVRAGVPAVIGATEKVTVEWTMSFMRPLYAALGKGRSIQEAFDHARTALRQLPNFISKTPSFDLPVLLGSGVNLTLCGEGFRGDPQVEQGRLFNWTETWSGTFHGDYVEDSRQGRVVDSPTGRKGFVAQAARAFLRDEKLLTITGVGGIGKTALATVVSRRMSWRFPGGVFWIDGRNYLKSTIPLDAVIDSFEAVLGEDFLKLPTERKRQRALSYMNRLECACLIVLDNADVASQETMRFLKELPVRSAALLTSREAPESGGSVIVLNEMSDQESLRFLLMESGRRQNDPFIYLAATDEGELKTALPEEEERAVIEIANLLAGHPLALLQAAALIADDGFMRTLDSVRAHPAQGKEIHERFDFSYATLTEELKRLLHRLAAFPVDFTEVCVQIVSTIGLFVKENDALPNWKSDLRLLRNKSMVERRNLNTGIRRFRLHPVMRDYIRAKLATIPAEKTFADSSRSGVDLMRADDYRIAHCFLMQGFSNLEALGKIEKPFWVTLEMSRERVNMIAAQEIFLSQEVWIGVIAFAYILDDLFIHTGYWTGRRAVLERGLIAANSFNKSDAAAEFTAMLGEHGETDMTAELTRLIGNLAEELADYPEARRQYEETLRLARELGDRKLEARILRKLGITAKHMGDFDQMQQRYRESSRISWELADESAIASTIDQHIKIIQQGGETGIAEALHKLMLDLKRSAGNKSGEFETLFELGFGAYQTKDYDKANFWLNQALHLSRELGHRSREAQVLHGLGKVAQDKGNYPEARRQYEESLAIIRTLGRKSNEAFVLADFAMLSATEGKHLEGMEFSLQAEEILLQLGNPRYISWIREERKVLESLNRSET